VLGTRAFVLAPYLPCLLPHLLPPLQLAVSNDTGVITSSGPSATLPPSAAFAFGLAVNSNPDGLAGGQGCAVVVVTARSSSGAATVYALDMTSGAMLWQTPVSGSAPENVPALSQPLFVGSLLLFSGRWVGGGRAGTAGSGLTVAAVQARRTATRGSMQWPVAHDL
jgi:hypothetical protein